MKFNISKLREMETCSIFIIHNLVMSLPEAGQNTLLIICSHSASDDTYTLTDFISQNCFKLVFFLSFSFNFIPFGSCSRLPLHFRFVLWYASIFFLLSIGNQSHLIIPSIVNKLYLIIISVFVRFLSSMMESRRSF